jgi:uncharacterized protein (DUF1810 family)
MLVMCWKRCNSYSSSERKFSCRRSAQLKRFIKAQPRDLLQVVEKELTEGKVKTCWYIFPQIHSLGQSEKTKYYSIKSLKEAKSYLDDRVLRERLVHHTKLVLNHRKYKIIWKILTMLMQENSFLA